MTTTVRDLYAVAAGWLSGDAEACTWLVDELAADVATALATCRTAAVTVAEEAGRHDDACAALEALDGAVADDPAVLGIADAAGAWHRDGEAGADAALAGVLARAGRRGAVTAAAVCVATAVELVCLAAGEDPLAHVRGRLLVLAGDASDGRG